jgi:DNA polymerase-3 subunit delta'
MPYFSKLTIQPQIIERLTESIKRGRLAHAYLFYGPEGSGKEAVAFELAKAVNCRNPDSIPCNACISCNKISTINHPDVKYIFPTASQWTVDDIKERIKQKAKKPYGGIDFSGHTTIQIERVRELKTEAKFAPYEGEKKVYIVSNAERMTRESSNSFLKILEEPPANLLIILTTSNLDLLLDTIRSRCQLMYFHPLGFKEALSVVTTYYPLTPQVEKVVHLGQGNLIKIFRELETDEDDKRKLIYSYMQSLMADDDLQIFHIIDEMVRTRDKNYLLSILILIILYLQDILHIKLFGQQTDIVNIDYYTKMVQEAGLYSLSGIEEIISYLEQASEQIKQNVYPQLVLTVLAFRIKAIMKQTARQKGDRKA